MLNWLTSRTVRLAVIYLTALTVLIYTGKPELPLPDRTLSLTSARCTLAGESGPGTAMSVPGLCRPDKAPRDSTVVVTVPLDVSAGTKRNLAILFDTLGSGMRVAINGAHLQTIIGAAPQAFPRPVFVLVEVPETMIVEGRNAIQLTIPNAGSGGAGVGRIYAGPMDVIRPHYTYLSLTLQTVPLLTLAWRLLLSTMLVVLFVARPRDVHNILFAGVLISGGAPSLRVLADVVQWPELAALPISLGLLWQAGLLVTFAYAFFEKRVSWGTFAFPIASLVLTLMILVSPQPFPFWLTRVVGPLCVFGSIMVMTAIIARATWRTGSLLGHLALATSLIVSGLVILEVIDLLTIGSSPFNRARFGNLVVLGGFSAAVIGQFILSLKAVDDFSKVLRQQLASARIELSEALERQHSQDRRAAIQDERERLMRDLHDGVSGRIMSAMAQCELRGPEFREIGQALRDALHDLRLVISSLNQVGGDLGQVLVSFRDQTSNQLRQFGVRLECRIEDLPPIPRLRPSDTLQVFRILQESVLNAARHSGAEKIVLTAAPLEKEGAAWVRIVVADEGRGGAADRDGGLGLKSMRYRAAALGGTLDLQSGAGGTVITIDLPLLGYEDRPRDATGPAQAPTVAAKA